MDTSPIVAVASFADDLEAVSELLSALPAECSVTLIIAQHLNAAHERLVAEALAKRTSLPVAHAHDGVVAAQGHIYVGPANVTLTMTGRRIRVTPSASKLHHPGDTLLTSLAEECGEIAIGVVLSGAGSDGALGIRAIRQRGGTTFAQYPGSARFPSMPISAIETGCVALVLRPNEIARELTRLSWHAAPPADVCPGRPSKRPPNSRSGFGIDPAVVRSLVRLPEETASAAIEQGSELPAVLRARC